MVRGLDVANQIRASGGGRKMFLTSPYIEQAISQVTRNGTPEPGTCSAAIKSESLPRVPHSLP